MSLKNNRSHTVEDSQFNIYSLIHKMNRQPPVEQDVKLNKTKEGFLFHKSRIQKEWKKRWIVLTKSTLYSFQHQGVYHHPSQKIALKDISTVKSFYKNQYDKSQVFRVESDDNYFYLSATDHQQKWAWVTAIEKVTQMLRNPNLKDNQNLIRQSIKMMTAVRLSGERQSIKNKKYEEIEYDPMKKIKQKIQSHLIQIQIVPFQFKKKKKISKVCNLKYLNIPPQKIQKFQPSSLPIIPDISRQVIERVIEKIVEVEVPVDRIVERRVEVQKIIYIQDQVQTQYCSLIDLFSSLITANLQDPKPLLDFAAFLTLTGIQKYQTAALEFCCQQSIQRFFAELLLQAINEQTAENRLNTYLGFIQVLCERQADYFYASDMRILVQIVLRQLEMNRSDLNQMISMRVLRVLLSYHLNILQYKRFDIQTIIEEIVNLGPQQNQQLASQILILIS